MASVRPLGLEEGSFVNKVKAPTETAVTRTGRGTGAYWAAFTVLAFHDVAAVAERRVIVVRTNRTATVAFCNSHIHSAKSSNRGSL